MILPKVRQRVVIDLHPPHSQRYASCASVRRATSRALPTRRASHAATATAGSRAQSPPDQPCLTHPDPLIEAPKILPDHIRPHQPCPMTFRQQRRGRWRETHLGAIGQNHACVSFHGRVTRSWPGCKNYTKSISRKFSQTLSAQTGRDGLPSRERPASRCAEQMTAEGQPPARVITSFWMSLAPS